MTEYSEVEVRAEGAGGEVRALEEVVKVWGEVVEPSRVLDRAVLASAPTVESEFRIKSVSAVWISPVRSAVQKWYEIRRIRVKILLSTLNASIDSDIDPRFGRATSFLIIDPETLEWQSFENPANNAPGGAGIQAAQFAANQGCEAAVSGEFGPNAFDTLNAAGVKMYVFGSCKTAREAIEKFNSGKLEELTAAAGSGHKFRPA